MIEVMKPGLLSSVQDLGRRARAQGVPAGGALDASALRLANALVGNPAGAAALEVTLLGPQLRFDAPALVALCGAPFEVRLDGHPFPMWRAVLVESGQVLDIGATPQGVRAVLTVRGGLVADRVLGSASTELRAGFGGFAGRALRAGDPLNWNPTPPAGPPNATISPELRPVFAPITPIRVLTTPEGEAVPDALEALLFTLFTLSSQADRMGLRLNGVVPAPADPSRASLPNAVGAVQLPPGGQPIVLLPDSGSHGGYPQPLVTIRADLAQLAQLRPGDRLRFVPVTVEQARAALWQQEQGLRQAEAGLRWWYARFNGA